MFEQHHQLNGHEFEQIPGDSEGQGSLACYTPWGCKVLDTTKRLNDNNHPEGCPYVSIILQSGKIRYFKNQPT